MLETAVRGHGAHRIFDMALRCLVLGLALSLGSASGKIVLPVEASAPVTGASVQDGGMCWQPDVEFPVPCDDDDD